MYLHSLENFPTNSLSFCTLMFVINIQMFCQELEESSCYFAAPFVVAQ